MADYFRKVKSLYATTANTFGTGTGVTITPASVSGLPTDTEITLTFDRVNSAGVETPNAMERIIGTVSGGNFVVRTSPTSGRGADGTSDAAHTSPVVEYIPNAKDINDMVDGMLIAHEQTGLHKSGLTLPSPVINGSVSGTGIDTDGTLAANSDTKVASQKAVKTYVDANAGSSDGWRLSSDTLTYASATSFTIAGVDRTSVFAKGTRIKLTQTTAKYFVVTSSSFSTDTTVNVTGGSDYSLANAAITSPSYSYQLSPQGYPGSFNRTPTVTAESGTYTSVAASGRFRVNGRTVSETIKVTLTTIGTGANAMDINTALTADAANYFASAWIDSGNTASGGLTTTTNIKIKKYDNTHPGTSGNIIYVSAVYDI